MNSDYQKPTALTPAWNLLQEKNDALIGDAADGIERNRNNATTVQIVFVLLLLILATALYAFILLYQRVSL